MLQINANNQGVLQVDCSEGEDFGQGILDWLCIFPNVQVNMEDLEYVTEDDDGELSYSSKEVYTPKMKESSMI